MQVLLLYCGEARVQTKLQMYFLLSVFVVLTTLVQCQGVVQLNRHTLPDGLQSVNGSNHYGGCSRVLVQGHICVQLDEGGTSDLTDCVIPFLGGFQNSWAAGFITVNTSGQSFHIGFEFNGPVNFTRVELDLFNCPEWGIAAQTITVYESFFGIINFDAGMATVARVIGRTTASTASCTSIVRVVIPLELPQNQFSYIIDFTFDNPYIQWIHIAEVRFLEEEGTQCPSPSSTAVVQTQLSQQQEATTTSIHETVQPTLPGETVRSTLLQETVWPTPGTAPLPGSSPVPIVIAIIVVILLVIVLGVVLAVILVRARRKNQKFEIQNLQTTVMEDEKVEYDEVHGTQLSTLFQMKENDAYQQHIMSASIREPPNTDNAVVYEEVGGGGRNQSVGFMVEENKAYGCHLQRGVATTMSPSGEVEYEEI